MAEVIRLRKLEKPPERMLRDLADDKDKEWQEIIVVGAYKDKDGSWIDCWYNAGSSTVLTGMLMRAILMLSQHHHDNE